MGTFSAALVVIAALLTDLGIEISAEISADTMLDSDAGAAVTLRPAPPAVIVDMAPGASLHWPR